MQAIDQIRAIQRKAAELTRELDNASGRASTLIYRMEAVYREAEAAAETEADNCAQDWAIDHASVYAQ